MANKYEVDGDGKSSWHTCSCLQTQITEGHKSKKQTRELMEMCVEAHLSPVIHSECVFLY